MDGLTVDQIAEKVTSGEVTKKAALDFVATRAKRKLEKKLAA